MASIETRQTASGAVRYRAQVRVAGYPSASATFARQKDARAWAARVEADMRAGRYLSDAAAREHTAGEMIDRYLRDILPLKSDKKRYIEAQKAQLLWWKHRLGDYRLIKVTPYVLTECRDALRSAQRCGATVNRYLAALNHVFTIAVTEWGWLQQNPLSGVRKYPELRGRLRYLAKEELEDLLIACQRSAKPELFDAVILAIETGARKDEILSIKPRHVDVAAGLIVLEETKNHERRQLTIAGPVLDMVCRRMKYVRKGQHYLIHGKFRHMKARIDDEFRLACKQAGIEDFRFHDLRHHFASTLAMNGASLVEISEALGHKSLNMVKRYAHLAESHTSKVIIEANTNSHHNTVKKLTSQTGDDG